MSGDEKNGSPYDYSDDEYGSSTPPISHDTRIRRDEAVVEKPAPIERSARPMTNQATSNKQPPFSRFVQHLEDFVMDVNWLHIAFKICAFSYIIFLAYLTWHILPINSHWNSSRSGDKIPLVYQDYNKYFDNFKGFPECNIRLADLYVPPITDALGNLAGNAFCPSRKELIDALSTGGRVGFDAPYMPKGCEYRWYTVAEMHMILERFNGLIFVGDQPLQAIYNGINILLQQDLATGSLKTSAMNDKAIRECSCDNQFVKEGCANYYIKSSKDIKEEMAGKLHTFLRTSDIMLDASLSRKELQYAVKQMLASNPKATYKPIPVITSVSPASSVDRANTLLADLSAVADAYSRKIPMLWVGPSAAGHVEVRGRKGNQEIWDFDRAMASTAQKTGVEVLGMWNMTVQATSFDGLHFGEKVAITQAMMVMNWLARLESS